MSALVALQLVLAASLAFAAAPGASESASIQVDVSGRRLLVRAAQQSLRSGSRTCGLGALKHVSETFRNLPTPSDTFRLTFLSLGRRLRCPLH